MIKIVSRHAVILVLFAIFCTFLVSLTHILTKNKIAEQQDLERLIHIRQVIPESMYDNNLIEHCSQITAPDYLGTDAPHRIYTATKQNTVSAYAIETTAPNGYSGAINLIVGIDTQGNILGVRVLSHQETPGLGDKIERRKASWILGFNGTNLENTPPTDWNVKKEGGVFDALTGATITPKAVITSVYKVLLLAKERPELFELTHACEVEQ